MSWKRYWIKQPHYVCTQDTRFYVDLSMDMVVLGLNDLNFLLNNDSVLHKIIYILCNTLCCLNKNSNIAFE